MSKWALLKARPRPTGKYVNLPCMTRDDTETNPLNTLMQTTRTAFAELGIEVEISEELQALTASADGGALIAILLVGSLAFLSEFAKLFADDAYTAVKKQVQRLRRSGYGDLVVSDGRVRVLIEPDLADDAIRKLAEPLPPAPSGELRYNRRTSAWTDSAK